MARKISQDIRDKIVDKIKNDGMSAIKAAQEFGISTNTIYNWLGKGKIGSDTLEIGKLKRENQQLKMIIAELVLNSSKGKKIAKARKLAVEKSQMIDKKKLAKKLGIARSTLYYRSKKKAKDEVIKKEIIEVMESNPAYGYRRVAIALDMNEKPVARIMKNNGLKPRLCRRKWQKKGDIGLPVAQYTNEVKNIEILESNTVWIADFTHIKYRSSWLYLATVIDSYTGEVIGAAISSRHNRFLVKSAALDAIKKRGLLPQYFHTDQGSEYQSEEHADFLSRLGVVVSMSRKGSPWENGGQESFFSHYKLELGNVNRFESEGELIANIYNQIYYFNNVRIKTKLRMAPTKFYELTAKG